MKSSENFFGCLFLVIILICSSFFLKSVESNNKPPIQDSIFVSNDNNYNVIANTNTYSDRCIATTKKGKRCKRKAKKGSNYCWQH